MWSLLATAQAFHQVLSQEHHKTVELEVNTSIPVPTSLSFSNNPGKMYPTKGQFDFSVQPLGGSEFSVQTCCCKFCFLFKGGDIINNKNIHTKKEVFL